MLRDGVGIDPITDKQFVMRSYKSLQWSCVTDPITGKNPNRICGNATEPPPSPKSSTDDTHEYPHEDIWPAGCFIHEKPLHAQLVFNDNFESEAKCYDSGQKTGSSRCLCRPKRVTDDNAGYDANSAKLKAKGFVLKCIPNGWCGYVDENKGGRTRTVWGGWVSCFVGYVLVTVVGFWDR